MARLMLIALVWSVVQGEEYGGGRMPHYGGVAADYAEPAAALALADYTGHSPDASAPLDYKYIEDPHESREKFQKDVDDTSGWEQRSKERRSRHDKDELEMIDSEAAVPKHKPSRSRHRSRLKSDKSRDPRRRRNRTYRGNEDDDDIRKEYMRNNHYRDEIKNEALDEEHVPIKETTERIIRRKARDRHFAPPPSKSVDLESEDENIQSVRKSLGKSIDTETEDEIIGSVRKMKDMDDKAEPDYSINQNRRNGLGRPPFPSSFDMDDDDDMIDSDIDFKKKTAGKRKFNKNYPDYNSYYDMKRVYNIKNRLPMLIRRTTTTIPSVEEDATPDVLKMLWTARRAASPPTITPQATRTTTTTTTTTTNTTTTTLNPVVMPIKLPSITKSSLSTTSLEISNFSTNKQLSLAERSRLSILKKAQRKESDKPAPSTKPPILLHVTNKLPTVVMVEPPPVDDPWMRAKEISNDSPDRLDKVKRLMRQKLVADAKNIKDLTDNWDEMVCDYVDISILDSQAFGTLKPTDASMAERELHAALGAHRRRKDLKQEMETPTSTLSSPTFALDAVDNAFNQQWNQFITNHEQTLSASLYVYLIHIVLINYLQIYIPTVGIYLMPILYL